MSTIDTLAAVKLAEIFTPTFHEPTRRYEDEDDELRKREVGERRSAQVLAEAHALAEAMQVQQDLRAMKLELKRVAEESLLQRARAIAAASLVEDILDEDKKVDQGLTERRLSDPQNSALRRVELLDRAVDEFSKLCGRELHPVERVDVRKKIGAQTKLK